jgi:hypothetical protein
VKYYVDRFDIVLRTYKVEAATEAQAIAAAMARREAGEGPDEETTDRAGQWIVRDA